MLPQIISEQNNSAIGLFVFCTLLKYPLVNTYGLRLIKPSLLPVKQTFLQSKRESSCSSQEILPRELRTIFRYHAKYVILTLMLSCKPSSSTKIFVVVVHFLKNQTNKKFVEKNKLTLLNLRSSSFLFVIMLYQTYSCILQKL